MKTKAAVLYNMEHSAPYADSRPLVVEELELAGPGFGEVLVEIASAGLCHSDLSVIDGSRPAITLSSRLCLCAATASPAPRAARRCARTARRRMWPERSSTAAATSRTAPGRS